MDENARIPVAVCEYEWTVELLAEGYRKMMKKAYRYGIICLVWGALQLAALLYAKLLGTQPPNASPPPIFAYWYVGFILVVLGIGILVSLKMAVRNSVNDVNFLSGSRVRQEFYEDEMRLHTEKGSAVYSYDAVINAMELKKIWIISLGRKTTRLVAIVAKDGFADADAYQARKLDGKKIVRLRKKASKAA